MDTLAAEVHGHPGREVHDASVQRGVLLKENNLRARENQSAPPGFSGSLHFLPSRCCHVWPLDGEGLRKVHGPDAPRGGTARLSPSLPTALLRRSGLIKTPATSGVQPARELADGVMLRNAPHPGRASRRTRTENAAPRPEERPPSKPRGPPPAVRTAASRAVQHRGGPGLPSPACLPESP